VLRARFGVWIGEFSGLSPGDVSPVPADDTIPFGRVLAFATPRPAALLKVRRRIVPAVSFPYQEATWPLSSP
jgi:hypothetical protein